MLVTGGSGFLGRLLVGELTRLGALAWGVGHQWDLTDPTRAEDLVMAARPDYVFHLAGYNGGIAFNLARPAEIFRRNTLMALNLFDALARKSLVKKVLSVVASCAYDDVTACFDPDLGIPFGSLRELRESDHGVLREEEDFLAGAPHESVAGHGYAKRNLQLASGFYAKQYGLDAVCVCPTTLYGPGDSWDPARTKLVGALVRRFADAADAGDPAVTCWGSGRPLREFLYAPDCARLLPEVLLRYGDNDLPLNLGTGQERTVAELAAEVAGAAGYCGRTLWDRGMPDGQLRKRLDTTRLASLLTFEPTPLREGLRRTVADYRRARGPLGQGRAA